MPTYSDICSNYTSDPSGYPASVQKQLRILAEWLYFMAGAGNGDPFNLTSKAEMHGIAASSGLTEAPSYKPHENGGDFFTVFNEGDLVIKALENTTVFKSSRSGSSAAVSSTVTNGVQKTQLLVSGVFTDFGVETITDGVRTFEETTTVCFLMVLIGNLNTIFQTPFSEGPSDAYGSPPLVLTPAIPGAIIPDCGGWFADTIPDEDERTPYWIVPGEGTSQTLPCISPRRLEIRQWGFTIDKKTMNASNRRI